ncbi:hypothetical protein QP150_16170 [Sphingomonas sp. 22L2VL55-3]
MSDGLRFTSSGLPGVQFVRRPVTELPAEGTACVVDDGHALGWSRRPVGALFKNGNWTNGKGRPLPFVPTFWTSIEVRSDAG